jgi:hypothetical protein
MLAGIASAVVVTARVLSPDPVHGSSAQLGMPPCGFQQFTGYRCPGCGLTTAFSYLAHLDVVGAWHVNAFGILLFLATAAFIPFAITGLVRGWSLSGALHRIHGEQLVIALSLVALAHWLVRAVVEGR